MRSKKVGTHIPLDLLPAFEKRAADEGYPSVSAYLVSLGVYDCSVARPHYATGKIHELSMEEQDRIYKEVGRACIAGETIGGSWFEARLEEATKKAGLAATPPASRVGQRIQRIIGE